MKQIIILCTLISIMSVLSVRADAPLQDRGPSPLYAGTAVHGEIWGSETGFINLGLRSSGKNLYKLVFLGCRPDNGSEGKCTIGLGMGKHQESGTGRFLDVDCLFQLVSPAATLHTEGTMFRFRLLAGHRFSNDIKIYAGPVYTGFKDRQDTGERYAPWVSSVDRSGGYFRRHWFGLVAGVRY